MKVLSKLAVILALAALATLVVIAIWAQEENPLLDQLSTGIIDWEGEVVRAEGVGTPPKDRPATIARMLARRAAHGDALRNLAETVYGVRVTSETTIHNFVTTNDEIRLQVDALIQGIRAADARYLADDSAEVTVEVNLYGQDGLSPLILPHVREMRGAATPGGQGSLPSHTALALERGVSSLGISASGAGLWLQRPGSVALWRAARGEGEGQPGAGAAGQRFVPPTQQGPYSGLVVVCENIGMRPCMSPLILDEAGNVVYGDEQMSSDDAVNRGVAGFLRRPERAVGGRAGDNPLFVSGLEARGPKRGDCVISNQDAARVLAENERSHFLDELKVLFLLLTW